MSVLIESLPAGAAADTLPVVKLTCWYGQPARGPVYSYARICLTQQGLRLVMTVFDGTPPSTQQAVAALGLGKGLVWLSFGPDGSVRAEYRLGDVCLSLPAPVCVLGRGSDEQGWYWQVDCTLTPQLLQPCLAVDSLVRLPQINSRFPVGFFLRDTQESPTVFGSAFADPAVTAGSVESPHASRCLGQAVVIAY